MLLQSGGFHICVGRVYQVGVWSYWNSVGEEIRAFRKQQAMRLPPSLCCTANSSVTHYTDFKYRNEDLEEEQTG